jgi:hypothetical protein
MTGCKFLFRLMLSANLPLVAYWSQLNKKTITATKTVTAKNASRMLVTTISITVCGVSIRNNLCANQKRCF